MGRPLVSTGPISGVSILLVEDDPGDAVLVQACLAELGIPEAGITWVRTLADGVAALAATPGCVLLDLGLPDADGHAAINQMVQAAPDTAVIVLTGREEHDGLETLAAGAQDYLAKDTINGEQLTRSIRYAMERKRAQRTQQQLREARMSAAEQARLERGLLPSPLLRTQSLTCATYYRPGRDNAVLGGDFFDVIETSDGRIRAVIGDVMGHGPDEAALGVHLRVAWRTLVLADTPDAQILPMLNRLLRTEQGGLPGYVTVCDLTLDADGRGAARVAGHPAPILCMNGTPTYQDVAVGPPLGVTMPPTHDLGWLPNGFAIPPGSSVVLYTDGLLEAYQVDPQSESLGIDELVAAIQRCIQGGDDPSAWIPTLVGSAPRESVDDTAVLVLTVADGA